MTGQPSIAGLTVSTTILIVAVLWRSGVVGGTVVRVKGIKRYRSPKNGLWYCYHRATKKRLASEFGTPGFFAELAKLDEEAGRSAAKQAAPGTLGGLILDYRTRLAFQDLATSTKRDYERIFTFLAPLHKRQLADFTPKQIADLRDEWAKETGRRNVNYIMAVLSVLLGYALERDLVERNPVKGVKRLKPKGDAPRRNRPWTLAERKVVLGSAPPHIRLPIALGMFVGLREGDVLHLPKNVVKDGVITWKTSKRGVLVSLPIIPELAIELERAPAHNAITLCANSRGLPWTRDGFCSSLRTFMKGLETQGRIQPGLTFHGLRHTVATVLREAGIDQEAIAVWLGQESVEMARHYSRGADTLERNRATVQKFKPLGPRKDTE
jgi:integrase